MTVKHFSPVPATTSVTDSPEAFGIQYTDKDNTLKYVHQTSWGMTTRMIGAIIMVHGDNSGLVLPPRIAPTQAVIIPIQQHKEGVLDKADELFAALKAAGIRAKVDDTDRSPGLKFAEQEMRGIPVRVECRTEGYRERTGCYLSAVIQEKNMSFPLKNLLPKFRKFLILMQKEMLERARAHRDAHTYVATNYEELQRYYQQQTGICQSYVVWKPASARTRSKKILQATSRCMPFAAGASERCLRMLRKTG